MDIKYSCFDLFCTRHYFLKRPILLLTALQKEIQRNQKLIAKKGITDEEVEVLKAKVNQKMTEFKVLMNDKAALFEEMYSNALILLNRDKQIILNEEEIIQLKHEIDINILEIEQKTFIISELQTKLAEKKATYKALKADIKELEDQCEELEAILKQKDEEIDTLEEILRDRRQREKEVLNG